MATYNISIDMDKKCSKCHKKGAMPNGICMNCLAKNMKAGKYDHVIKKIQNPTGQQIFQSMQDISEQENP